MKDLPGEKPNRPPVRAAFAGIAIATFALMGLGAVGVAAKPSVKTRTIYYEVYASTSRQLKSQMRLHGPKGFWAYARWYVRWTGDCRLSVEITYTMPRWVNKGSAPKVLQRQWERMIKNLWLHERGHGRHGIMAAREIERVGCRGAKRITRKWAQQDRIYDRRTKHGRTQGVRLP